MAQVKNLIVNGVAKVVNKVVAPTFVGNLSGTINGYSIAKSVPSDANFNNTTYSASTGLSLSGTAFSLGTSGVTAGSYGPSANATPGYSASFNVPYITVDAYGRVTAASTKTVTIPASDNTNTWRGIQNNLTSTSTTDSLSAAQGKALNDSKVSKGCTWGDLANA